MAADHTAVRTALWRALHLDVDPPPHVVVDDLGLRIAAPEAAWRERPDMDPQGTRPFRASIVARARFLDDLVAEQVERGVAQYAILGAGLDTFAQRHAGAIAAAGVHVFEIDRPETQAWKRARLAALGIETPAWLHFVPVDFEANQSWLAQLAANGFDATRPAVVASTGVSMYLTRAANTAVLREVATLAPGTTFAMTFLLPLDLGDAATRPAVDRATEGAKRGGTPFVSFFTPSEITALARAAGFPAAHHVSADDLAARYFAGRADGLRPPPNGEEVLVASTSPVVGM